MGLGLRGSKSTLLWVFFWGGSLIVGYRPVLGFGVQGFGVWGIGCRVSSCGAKVSDKSRFWAF